jgi:hypothetical protein
MSGFGSDCAETFADCHRKAGLWVIELSGSSFPDLEISVVGARLWAGFRVSELSSGRRGQKFDGKGA